VGARGAWRPGRRGRPLLDIVAVGPLCELTACRRRPGSSCVAESPLPDVGDHHPENFDLPPAGAHGPRLRGRETVAHEQSQQLGLEAVRKQDRLGAAKGAVGEQPKCPSEDFLIPENHL
jgi:hypothetical protein